MNYPLSAHVVLVPAVGVDIKKSTLQDMGVQSLPDSDIQVFSGGTIARNEALEFRLTGNPYTSQDGSLLSGENARWYVIGLGSLGVGLLASGIWIYFKNKTANREISQTQPSPLDRDEILDSIIALEDLFQAGEITESAFQAKRDQLKEQLREISGNE
jgi:hypothetical protein